jgi:molybdopterin molybdotransferase
MIHGQGELDLLITSGGVSMGEFDWVRKLLEQEGEVLFWRANIQPGGPVLLGRLAGQTLLGLPGNPVSSLVTFLLFARPAIFKMLGLTDDPLPERLAQIATATHGLAEKLAFRRGVFTWERDHYVVRELPNQSSGALHSLSEGNCLIRLEPQQDYPAGSWVRVIALESLV